MEKGTNYSNSIDLLHEIRPKLSRFFEIADEKSFCKVYQMLMREDWTLKPDDDPELAEIKSVVTSFLETHRECYDELVIEQLNKERNNGHSRKTV